MRALLRVASMTHPGTGFAASVRRCWETRCQACVPGQGAIVARSASLNRQGWIACMAAAYAHLAAHKKGREERL